MELTAAIQIWHRVRLTAARLAPLGIHFDPTGQLLVHGRPTHPDGEEQTERHKSQVRKGRSAVRLKDPSLGDEQSYESAEYGHE